MSAMLPLRFLRVRHFLFPEVNSWQLLCLLMPVLLPVLPTTGP